MGNWNWRKRRKYSHYTLPLSESCRALVLNWDDSAAKEAFFSSKRRIWGETSSSSSLPRDSTFLDPDIFIDEIDWYPHIDPEAIFDLEKEHVDPDDVGRVERKDPPPIRSNSGNENPWECGFTEVSSPTDDREAAGWGNWDRSTHLWLPCGDNVSGQDTPVWNQASTITSTTIRGSWAKNCYGRKQREWDRASSFPNPSHRPPPVLPDHRAFRNDGWDNWMGMPGGSFRGRNRYRNTWE